jgi:cell division protein FtsZ
VLLNITGSSNLGLYEVNEAATIISEAADPDANIIFGAVIDESLGDEIRITVIATGFEKTSKKLFTRDGSDLKPFIPDDDLVIPFLRRK